MSEFRVRPRPAPYPGMVRRSSAAALLAAVLAGLAGLLPALALISRDAWLSAREPGPAELGTLVMALTGPIALGLAGWLLIAVLLSAVDALVTRRRARWAHWAPQAGRSSSAAERRWLSGVCAGRPERPAGAGLISRCARRVAPAVLRHGVAALIGVTLLSAPATAATSAPGSSRGPAVVAAEPAASPGAFSAAWPPVRAEVIAAAQDRFTVVPGYVTAEITPDDVLAGAARGGAGSARDGARATSTGTTSTGTTSTGATSTGAAEAGPASTGAAGGGAAGTRGAEAGAADAGAVRGWVPAPPADRGDPSAHVAGAGADLDAVAATGRRRRLDDNRMVVRRGDTLWSIASRSLGPGATEAQIAGEWPHWFTANRDVIGPDPDRLLPGQQLRPPIPGARSRSSQPRPGSAIVDPSSAGDQR